MTRLLVCLWLCAWSVNSQVSSQSTHVAATTPTRDPFALPQADAKTSPCQLLDQPRATSLPFTLAGVLETHGDYTALLKTPAGVLVTAQKNQRLESGHRIVAISERQVELEHTIDSRLGCHAHSRFKLEFN
ncbi:pilus assembly protein PilP [Vibrio pacinii]|uniref:pilus assembly protein PilP n=1 Tax=Vibrio pacinii TaxID=170674 RepID=UPI00056F69EA|nr:pilus assembly protein PilP [Vibrio pacinii]